MKFNAKKINSFSLSLQALTGFGWVTLALVGYGAITWLFSHFLPQAVQQVILRLLAGTWSYIGYAVGACFVLLLLVVLIFSRSYPTIFAYLRSASETKGATAYLAGSTDAAATVGEDGTLTVKKKAQPRVIVVYLGHKVLVALLAGSADTRDAMEAAEEATKEYTDGLLQGYHTGAMQRGSNCRYWVYSR